MIMTNQSYIPQQYLVCYIDLLGIREKLFDGIDYHNSDVSIEKQEEINLVSTQINTLLEGLNYIDIKIHENPGELYDFDTKYVKYPFTKEEFISQIEKTHFSIQQFSDSTLIYVPFTQGTEHAVINILCVWIIYLASWCLLCMSQGIMFRGAMTIGTAWELRTQCLFGPAVHEVYRLETESAKHPRIIISESLNGFIRNCLDSNRNAGINVDYLPTPLHMVHTDDDGVNMLHYLSKVVKAYAEFNGLLPLYKQQISKSFDYLFKEYNLHIKDSNINTHSAELARRYLSVIRYFLRYNDDWDNCITEQMKTYDQCRQ